MKGLSLKLICFCIFILSQENLQAQISSDQYSFNYYSTAQGLSNNSVICTQQDKLGYIWIGTKDGLNRFDGRNFRIYRRNPENQNSISNNYILEIFQDRDSVLWIGTKGGGLCRYDRKTDSFTPFLYNENDIQSISHPEVLCIFQDSEGILWVGTDGGGINKMLGKSGKFKRFDKLGHGKKGLSSLKILSIAEYDKDNLLIGTWDGGLNIFHKETGECRVLTEKDGMSSNNIWLIQKEGDKGFWIGHFEKGLQFWNKGTGKIQTIEFPGNLPTSAYAVINQQPDRLWIGTSTGIFTTRISYLNNMLTYEPLTLLNNFFSLQITMVKNNSIWAANFDNGLMHIYLNDPQFRITEIKTAPGSVNLVVNAFNEITSNEIIVGTTHGLWKYNEKKLQVSYLENSNSSDLASKRITTICRDSQNRIFLGRPLFVANYLPGNNHLKQVYKIPANFKTFERDGYYDIKYDKGWFWFATENGLFKYNPQSRITIPVIKMNAKFKGYNIYQVRSIDLDNENVYAGTVGGGLVVVDKISGKYKVFQNEANNPASIASNIVNQVYIARDGKIWLATFNGLVYFDKQKEIFRHFGIREGFQAEIIMAITGDKAGNLWISSQHGITKYNPNQNRVENFYFYTQGAEKSFQTNSVFASSNGRIYFGRRSGFISFHPDSINLRSKPPVVLITGLKINNNDVTVTDENSVLKTNIESTKKLKLSHDQNSFAFSFAAMDFSFVERNRYAYFLENFDNEWVYTSVPSANYTKVSPGKYVFRVRASNQDGVWNEEGASIEIFIRPAFWQTLIFKILVVVILVILTKAIYNWRLRSIRKDRSLLQKIVEDKTKELSDANHLLENQNIELLYNKKELQNKHNALEQTNKILEEKTKEVELKNIELEHHRENLEKLIDERTIELKVAKEKAEQSDRLKTAFLANLSHEIRTPLNAIVGFSAMLEKQNLSSVKRQEYNNIIQSSSDSLLILIDDIINLAKIETDQIEIFPESFSVNKLIQELYSTFIPKIENNKISLKLAAPDKEIFVYSDYFRVKQILINFITNALKFTEKGFIEIGCQFHDESGIALYVRDTGIGIDRKHFDTVFERFQKLENPNSKFYQGVGLGLAICKKLSELLGAKIDLKSEIAKGSTFYLIFDNYSDSPKVIKSN